MTEKKSILVIFGKELPKKKKSWFKQFDEVLYPNDLEKFIGSGSIQGAYEFVNELSRLTMPDGSHLPKLINYHGYDLWWIHYEDLYHKFCLPYTQLRNLLLYLKNFDKAYIFQTPYPYLFRHFLKAHNRQCVILKQFGFRDLLPLPFGVLIQFLLSLGFLVWLGISRPKLMIRTTDKFDYPHDFDFRYKIIYGELRKRRIPFAEFVRSLEPWPVVLRHAWRRKRPVVYSAAITEVLNYLAGRFGRFSPPAGVNPDPEKRFWFSVALHYFAYLRGTDWSIQAMKFILKLIGIKAAIIPAACNRTFYEVLGCKLAGIKTVGIQHGAIPRYYFVSDFMPEFDGKKPLSLDKYGLWSDGWRENYLKYGRAFKPEQLCVSGPMRPLEKEMAGKNYSRSGGGQIRVLFISEQLAEPKEVMPYLSTLLAAEDFALSLKFRSQGDGFENWLKKNKPDILGKAHILRGNIHEAISESDVVVGSHSTPVLEGLLQLKPFVFFWTNKWGDYHDIRSIDSRGYFFADSPGDLAEKIRKAVSMPREDLEKLQKRFFGDPNKNGSIWVVDQAEKFLNPEA